MKRGYYEWNPAHNLIKADRCEADEIGIEDRIKAHRARIQKELKQLKRIDEAIYRPMRRRKKNA